MSKFFAIIVAFLLALHYLCADESKVSSSFFIFTIMRKYFLHKRITTAISVLTVFSLFFVSCTNLLEGLGISEIEDYWQFDCSDEEDRELIKGKWILKKVGYECWDEVDNPYVDTEDIPQISHIESLQIDFEGEHMILTFNFNRPTLVEYRIPMDDGSIQSADTWNTSLTVSYGPTIRMDWEYLSKASGSDYDYDGEVFVIYDLGEEHCRCYDYGFNCLYSVKNVITDEKGEINRLIMNHYPSYNHNYDYEFERE